MSKVNAPFFSHSASGSIGKTIQAGSLRGTHWMRTAVHRSYTRSTLQEPQRLKFQEAKNAWLELSPSEKAAYNVQANALHPPITGYNYFLRLYLTAPAPVPPPPELLLSSLHFNGEDGATEFIDETGKIWTPHEPAHLDISQYVSPPSSGCFDGITAFIDTPPHNDFNLGSQNFIIEVQIKSPYFGETILPILDQEDSGELKYILFSINAFASQQIFFEVGCSESIWFYIDANISFEPNTWYHLAIKKDNGILQLFLNEEPVGDPVEMLEPMPSCDGNLWIGKDWQDRCLNAWLDDFKITIQET